MRTIISSMQPPACIKLQRVTEYSQNPIITSTIMQCNGITALRQFFSKLRDRQTQYIAVVGAGCSPATEPVAEIVNYYNMPMVSCTLHESTCTMLCLVCA